MLAKTILQGYRYMKILIAYATVTGTTAECVRILKYCLRRRQLTVVDLTEEQPDPLEYDAVVVGGPIRRTKLHPVVSEYIQKYAEVLKTKKTGYFIVCGFADEAEEQIKKNIPRELQDTAFDVVSFGGTLDVSKQKNWKDKLYIRFMRNTITDTGDDDAVEDGEYTRVLPTINPDTISRFASKLN